MLPREFTSFQDLAEYAFSNLDLVWTYLLLVTRCTVCFAYFPGIGGGAAGVGVRLPAILVLTMTFLSVSVRVPVPADWVLVAQGVLSEVVFGLILGLVPLMVIAGVQTGGQLASTSMGLSAGSLFDPNLGASVTEFSKVLGDLVVVTFLALGGHHYIVSILSGLGGEIAPGSYLVSESSVEMVIMRSAHIFRVALLTSTPVLVCLLLTQFVLGLMSKMVPTLNIFVVSFPLTVGLGLTIGLLSLPSVVRVAQNEFLMLEGAYSAVIQDMTPLPDLRRQP